jgi:hypothetical protein
MEIEVKEGIEQLTHTESNLSWPLMFSLNLSNLSTGTQFLAQITLTDSVATIENHSSDHEGLGEPPDSVEGFDSYHFESKISEEYRRMQDNHIDRGDKDDPDVIERSLSDDMWSLMEASLANQASSLFNTIDSSSSSSSAADLLSDSLDLLWNPATLTDSIISSLGLTTLIGMEDMNIISY